MRSRIFYLASGLAICLIHQQMCVYGSSVIAENGDEDSNEMEDTSSVPVFVRSRFNLRIWSTTEGASTTEYDKLVNATGSLSASNKSSKKPNRFKVSTSTSTSTEATTINLQVGVNTTEVPTTTQAPTSNTVVNVEEPTTLKIKARKLSSPECGELNGDDVPWIAVLEHTNPKGGARKKTLSKGVLIDDRHVLTTISSIHNSYPFWIVTGIRLGDTPTWAASKGTKEISARKQDVVSVSVKNVFLHEKKDIAVIRLSERVTITDKIRPICLPMNDRVNFTDIFFHVCKKDKSDFGRPSTSSKMISVTYLGQKDCQILFRRHQAELGSKEFCVWDETGDNCTGDLGGPLMSKLNGRYHVVGLNSYAMSKSKIDSEGLPGVYVRVGSFLKWIQAVLKTEFDDFADGAA
ncbi:CLIP domain-containing serine protease B4-like [Armigeres subalbatus]|uniref:CLIP domain-containing serine protease B4-like n=1 Tax=Armigeres subalbatus TaxID=124917 RepID=UPI002ED3973C